MMPHEDEEYEHEWNAFSQQNNTSFLVPNPLSHRPFVPEPHTAAPVSPVVDLRGNMGIAVTGYYDTFARTAMTDSLSAYGGWPTGLEATGWASDTSNRMWFGSEGSTGGPSLPLTAVEYEYDTAIPGFGPDPAPAQGGARVSALPVEPPSPSPVNVTGRTQSESVPQPLCSTSETFGTDSEDKDGGSGWTNYTIEDRSLLLSATENVSTATTRTTPQKKTRGYKNARHACAPCRRIKERCRTSTPGTSVCDRCSRRGWSERECVFDKSRRGDPEGWGFARTRSQDPAT